MRSSCALLWDESFLWGVMSYHALRDAGLSFDLIRAEDIRAGGLEGRAALFVPGGWASNKLKALGEDGAEAIREFVSGGGSYIGLCGGAGLATSGGLGLLGINRKPLKERVPSLSGRVRLLIEDSPVFKGINDPVFSLWWPSQFVVEDDSLNVLARMDEATDEAFSSDINIGDMKQMPRGWSDAEEAYGINLDPERMKGDPLVVEGVYGKGRVLVSLVHFDTPGCSNGAHVLRNIWESFSLGRTRPVGGLFEDIQDEPTGALFKAMSGLFDLGARNFLWFQRGPLVQWRRGVRGLEFFTLKRLAHELSIRAGASDLAELEPMALEFSARASKLLLLESDAIRQGAHITFAKATSPEMQVYRKELFGKGKSHGGAFIFLLDRMDRQLYELFQEQLQTGHPSAPPATGLVHIYTGTGKGKTTASVGMALRARSRGLRVLYAQFMKQASGGETEALSRQGIDVQRFREVLSPLFNPEEDMDTLRSHALKALKELGNMLGDYDLVVADEFVTMVSRGLVTETTALDFISARPEGVELVLTGRGASQALMDAADLVSEISEIKHYSDKKVKARKGIEY